MRPGKSSSGSFRPPAFAMEGLKESRRVPMWNGPIECRLFRFDLVAGSARKT